MSTAATRGERGAEAEDAGIDPVDVDAEGLAVSRSHWVARMTRPMRVRVSSSQTAAEEQRAKRRSTASL